MNASAMYAKEAKLKQCEVTSAKDAKLNQRKGNVRKDVKLKMM